MSLRWFRILLSISSILVVILGVFLFDSMRWQYVFPSTTFNGVSLGRHSHESVYQYLNTIEQKIFEEPMMLEIADESFEVTLDAIGFTFNKEIAAKDIFAVGHEMNFPQRLQTWVGSWFGFKTDIPLDEDILYLEPEVFSVFIAGTGITTETLSLPFDGEIRIEGNGVFADAPRDGYGINTNQVKEKALALLSSQSELPWVIALDTTRLSPQVSQESFQEYRRSLTSYLSRGLRLAFQGEEIVSWSPEELFEMLEIRQEGTGWFLRIPESNQDIFLKDLLARDAEFVVEDDYTVTIQPSEKGFIFDKDNLVTTFHHAFDMYEHVLNLTKRERTDPRITTEDLEAMEVAHVIAEFTTYYDCCQDRVTNIQRMADIVDGALIMPQESFELNEYVGERTLERGFVPAGALFFGEHVDDVGGGVSQFATTLYNAAYWSGLWIETHKPHSQYFSRYPEGIEATVSWKYPTLRFTNDYTTPVVIKTRYTNTSLTVMILGNNDGRIVVGDHSSGNTNIETIAPGGEASRIVTSVVGPRYNIKPSPMRYIAYPQRYLPGDQRVTEIGREGWAVDVTRSVFYPDIPSTFARTWTVVYVHPTITHVHSCEEVADSAVPCFTGQ